MDVSSNPILPGLTKTLTLSCYIREDSFRPAPGVSSDEFYMSTTMPTSSEDTTAYNGNTISFTEYTKEDYSDTTSYTEDTTAYTEDTTAYNKKSNLYTEDTTESNEDTTAYTEDTISYTEDITAYNKDSTKYKFYAATGTDDATITIADTITLTGATAKVTELTTMPIEITTTPSEEIITSTDDTTITAKEETTTIVNTQTFPSSTLTSTANTSIATASIQTITAKASTSNKPKATDNTTTTIKIPNEITQESTVQKTTMSQAATDISTRSTQLSTIRPPTKTSTTDLKITTQTPQLQVTSSSADVSHLMSIVITKGNSPGEDETVAQVTPYDPAAADGSYIEMCMVNGSVSHTPVNGELGYLSIFLRTPLEDQVGTYKCEANALTHSGHLVTFKGSIEIQARQPNVADLVQFIIYFENRILELEQENQEYKHRLDLLEGKGKIQLLLAKG